MNQLCRGIHLQRGVGDVRVCVYFGTTGDIILVLFQPNEYIFGFV